MNDILLKIENLSKNFPGVIALNEVTFSVKKGEIHAIVGENGAGKSTLIKILSGIYDSYEGNIIFEDLVYKIKNPVEAYSKGISTIFQELNIIPRQTILENIFLGREIVTRGVINRKAMYKKCLEQLQLLSVDLNPNSLADNLSIAYQQIIEISKALVFDAKLIIMDEPTSSLTKNEVTQLFKLIKKLKSKGKTILYISHKLDEVFEISDSITVLRDGKHQKTMDKKDTDPNEVITLMIGKKMAAMFPAKPHREKKEIIMTIKNLGRKNEFYDIDFDLYKGEILGICGLMGSGRTEIAKSIFGLSKPDIGEIKVFNSRIMYFKDPKEALKQGIAYLPENRKDEGIFPKLTVKENICMSIFDRISTVGFINNKEMNSLSKGYIDQFRIKVINNNQIEETLSGGNQQKTIISRLLSNNSKIFIFDEPTRGIDIGSKFEIYEIMNEICNKGGSIIFITSEIPELLSMSDRIILMRNGKIIKKFEEQEFRNEDNIFVTETQIMHIITGGGEGKI